MARRGLVVGAVVAGLCIALVGSTARASDGDIPEGNWAGSWKVSFDSPPSVDPGGGTSIAAVTDCHGRTCMLALNQREHTVLITRGADGHYHGTFTNAQGCREAIEAYLDGDVLRITGVQTPCG